jgi:murein DD-endopeptidase MepM/ murein hydrolase activator NlpD
VSSVAYPGRLHAVPPFLVALAGGCAAHLRGASYEGVLVARPDTLVQQDKYHPVLHVTRMHNGDDMAAGQGEPIHACRAGTVVIADVEGGYGNAVVIDHGGGMATLYAHQSRIASGVGQHVDAGQVIGYVGATGLATGPHLHFEVRLSGNPVDPSSYL